MTTQLTSDRPIASLPPLPPRGGERLDGWPRKHDLLGVHVSTTTYEEATAAIIRAARDRRPVVVSLHAVHSVVSAAGDPELGRKVNSFQIVAPDGQPVRWALNLLHRTRLRDRVYGPELMLRLCRRSAEEGVPVYFYGGEPEVVRALRENLVNQYPRLAVAGAESPPFRPLTPHEDEAVVRRINASGAGIVFIGLGCPKQDHFAYDHCQRINAVQVCVGAAFDFHSGNKKMAPRWMQQRGLEWFFRLWQEPRRLWRRYLATNTLFIEKVALQWVRQRLAPSALEVSPEPGMPALPAPPRGGSTACQEKPRVAVVVPCYNEEPSIAQLLEKLSQAAESLDEHYQLEFILVDDGSIDGTWRVLCDAVSGRDGFALLRHERNRGVAAAIMTGIRHANTEIVCSIDADCTYDPRQLRQMLPLLADGVDLVTASPYHPAGSVRNVPAWRLALSKCASLLYRRTMRQKLFTYTSCFRVYRRSAVAQFELDYGGFAGIAELVWKANRQGSRIVECPAELHARRYGRSKMKMFPETGRHLKLMTRALCGRLQRRTRPPRETAWEKSQLMMDTQTAWQMVSLPSDQDASGRTLGDREIDLLADVIRSGTLTSTKGAYVKAVERRFAEIVGVRHAYACSSGTAALHTAVAAIDPQPGDEVVTTPITDMGAITPILYQAAIPVFADVDPATFNITAETVEAVLSERTKAIIVTHLFGNPCRMGEIMELARSRAIPVIEDCAQAYLARHRGRTLGAIGEIGCFSLQQGKHITTGEGGLVTTNRPDLARRMFLFINKAWGYGDAQPDHYFLALNYRMSELQGAVAAAQLENLEQVVARRVAMAGRLTARLTDLPGVTPPIVDPEDEHVFWKYCLRVDENVIPGGPAALGAKLKKRGVACAPRYIQKPAFMCQVIAQQKTFGGSRFPFTLARPEAVSYDPVKFPGTFRALAEVLVLPWNEGYTTEHVDYIGDCIGEAVSQLARKG